MKNQRIKIQFTCVNCGLEFYPFRNSTGLYCSLNCEHKYHKNKKYLDYLKDPSIYYGKSNMRWVKPFILEELNNKCNICGISPIWNGKPLIFILDHIDGHSNNNARENLQLICSNCDSQLDTYKSKNKNSDRVYYKINQRRGKEIKEKIPRMKEKHYCYICGKEVSANNLKCSECAHKAQRKVERPSKEELKELIRHNPFTKIGEMYGVSDLVVHKWCEWYGLPNKASIIKKMTDEEWDAIN